MAFLDNSGDIILDAVLTDTGRFRLAKGNGSFKIAKFALGDDEIDYSLYDKNNVNGSAYFDLNILQTPILEAFTNNASSLKSKLLTITRTDLLYLPVMKLNIIDPAYQLNTQFNIHLISADSNTSEAIKQLNPVPNFIDGVNKNQKKIRIDQGLDTVAGGLTNVDQIPQDLKENQYIVEIDNRLGKIITVDASPINASESFIDDDNIATYYFSNNVQNNGGTYVKDMIIKQSANSTSDPENTQIVGARGTKLEFSIMSATQLQTTDYLFDTLGSQTNINTLPVKYIDTTVRVMGATTGYRVDVPIRFVKIY
jgi:hypothetical protein